MQEEQQLKDLIMYLYTIKGQTGNEYPNKDQKKMIEQLYPEIMIGDRINKSEVGRNKKLKPKFQEIKQEQEKQYKQQQRKKLEQFVFDENNNIYKAENDDTIIIRLPEVKQYLDDIDTAMNLKLEFDIGRMIREEDIDLVDDQTNKQIVRNTQYQNQNRKDEGDIMQALSLYVQKYKDAIKLSEQQIKDMEKQQQKFNSEDTKEKKKEKGDVQNQKKDWEKKILGLMKEMYGKYVKVKDENGNLTDLNKDQIDKLILQSTGRVAPVDLFTIYNGKMMAINVKNYGSGKSSKDILTPMPIYMALHQYDPKELFQIGIISQKQLDKNKDNLGLSQADVNDEEYQKLKDDIQKYMNENKEKKVYLQLLVQPDDENKQYNRSNLLDLNLIEQNNNKNNFSIDNVNLDQPPYYYMMIEGAGQNINIENAVQIMGNRMATKKNKKQTGDKDNKISYITNNNELQKIEPSKQDVYNNYMEILNEYDVPTIMKNFSSFVQDEDIQRQYLDQIQQHPMALFYSLNEQNQKLVINYMKDLQRQQQQQQEQQPPQ